jgi:hypothetical protein
MKQKHIEFILGCVLLLIITFGIAYYSYNYGYFIGNLEGKYQATGNEWICGKLKGTLQSDGYCLIPVKQQIKPEKIKQYNHYFDCSWGKLAMNVNQRDYNAFDFSVFKYTRCKPVKIKINYYK